MINLMCSLLDVRPTALHIRVTSIVSVMRILCRMGRKLDCRNNIHCLGKIDASENNGNTLLLV